MVRAAGLAVGIVALAIITLGTEWTGVEISPNVWRDRPSPGQWAVFAALLALLGIVAGRWLPLWRQRLAVIVPLLAWMTWQLQVGTLWPFALAIYGGGSALCWLAGCALSGLVRIPSRA